MSKVSGFFLNAKQLAIESRNRHGSPIDATAHEHISHAITYLKRAAQMASVSALASMNVAMAQPDSVRVTNLQVDEAANLIVSSNLKGVDLKLNLKSSSNAAPHASVKEHEGEKYCVIDISNINGIPNFISNQLKYELDGAAFRKAIVRHELAHCQAFDDDLKNGHFKQTRDVIKTLITNFDKNSHISKDGVDMLFYERQADIKAVLSEASEVFRSALTPHAFEIARENFKRNVQPLIEIRTSEANMVSKDQIFNDHDTLFIYEKTRDMVLNAATNRFSWWKFERAVLKDDDGFSFSVQLAGATIVRDLPEIQRRFLNIKLEVESNRLNSLSNTLAKLSSGPTIKSVSSSKGDGTADLRAMRTQIGASLHETATYLTSIKEELSKGLSDVNIDGLHEQHLKLLNTNEEAFQFMERLAGDGTSQQEKTAQHDAPRHR